MLLVTGGRTPWRGSHPTTAVEDEVSGSETERPPHLFDLVDEPVELPQRRVVGLIAETRPELVVVVVLHPGRRKEAVAGLQVLVGSARPAVEQEHLEIGVVADPLGPHLQRPGRGVDRDHPGAAAQPVVPARVVQVVMGWSHPPPISACRQKLPPPRAGMRPGIGGAREHGPERTPEEAAATMSPTPSNEPGRDARPAALRPGRPPIRGGDRRPPRRSGDRRLFLASHGTVDHHDEAGTDDDLGARRPARLRRTPPGDPGPGPRHRLVRITDVLRGHRCRRGDLLVPGRRVAGPVSPAPGPVGGGGISVSCADPSLCAAVPTAGSQVVTGTGQSWSPPQTLPGATDLGAVGCAPTGYCASVDAEGYAFAFDDGRWGATSGDWGSVADIACVSSTFCVSVSGGISQWNGSSWTQPDSYAAVGSFTSVSCPSSVFCAAAVNSGDVMFLQGQTWGPPTRIEPGAAVHHLGGAVPDIRLLPLHHLLCRGRRQRRRPPVERFRLVVRQGRPGTPSDGRLVPDRRPSARRSTPPAT